MKVIAGFFIVFLLTVFELSAASNESASVSEKSAELVNVDAATVSQIETIPFKEEKSLSQQSSPVIAVMLAFIIMAAVFMYFFKNKLSLVSVPGSKNIQVLEVKRMNPRLTAFHVKVKNKELLILQSGDSIKTLDIKDEPDSSEES